MQGRPRNTDSKRQQKRNAVKTFRQTARKAPKATFGEVAERSIAAGCKPAALGLRRFEPSPPHHLDKRFGDNELVERLRKEGGSNSVVESQPSKLLVAGSIPVSRSRFSIEPM